MFPGPALLNAAAAAGPVGGTWNPADAQTGKYTFSSGNKVATSNLAGVLDGSVRGTQSRSAGKRYVEFISTDSDPGSAEMWLGIADAGMPLTGKPGVDFTGGSFIFYRCNSQIFADDGFRGAPGSNLNAGQVLSLSVDLGAGSVIFKINNVTQTTQSFTAGTVFPAMMIQGGVVWAGTLKSSSSEQTYAPPAGYTAWDT